MLLLGSVGVSEPTLLLKLFETSELDWRFCIRFNSTRFPFLLLQVYVLRVVDLLYLVFAVFALEVLRI